MVNISETSFLSGDGVHQIYCRQWTPAEGPVRAAVQLVHGVAEHIGRYDGFASFLAEHGFAVAGDDHLGHGRTAADETELGWFSDDGNGWRHLAEDEKKLRDILREQYPAVPLILFGHSMGSFIARTCLGWYPGDWDMCVLSGTGHQPDVVCRFGRALAGREIKKRGSKYRSAMLQSLAFGGYLKKIDAPVSPNAWICRDETVVRAYDADPYCAFTATAGLMRDMMEGLGIIGQNSHMAKMDKAVPMLFAAGEMDPVGNYGKGVKHVADAFQRAGMRDVTVKLYPDMRHEILNEIGKETVWQDLLDWMEQKL